jgi:hypothetical protein
VSANGVIYIYTRTLSLNDCFLSAVGAAVAEYNEDNAPTHR